MARYSGAIWRSCPKHGYGADDAHLHQGVVIHSAEGSAAGLLAVLDNPSRKASWHFHVNKDGAIYQPMDTDNVAWANGSREANQRFWGIENEGRAPESLTESQYQSNLALVKWLWVTYKLEAPVRLDNMWEHREMTRFGALPTSCPGGRVPWVRLIADMQEEDMDRKIFNEWFAENMKAAVEANGQLVNVFEGGFPHLDHAASGAVVRGHPDVQPSEVQKRISAAVREHARGPHGGGGGLRRGDTVRLE